MPAEVRKKDPDARAKPNSNWGDDVFIPQLIERNK
jgi:hypothetical protein